MNVIELQQSQRLAFTTQTVAEILGISEASASVLCSRYAERGILLRLKKNLYVLSSAIGQFGREDWFYLSNFIQTPSYVSFMTALSYYGVSTQVTREVIEAVSPVRTSRFQAGSLVFETSKIAPALYFGFERVENFFVASREKALLDCLYFSTLGKYSLDASSLDLAQLSLKMARELARRFPPETRAALDRLLKIRS